MNPARGGIPFYRLYNCGFSLENLRVCRLGPYFRGSLGCLRLSCFFFFLTVLSHEFLYTASRIDELLLTCEEWVTIRADLNLEITDRGSRLECVAANTSDDRPFVRWMDTFLHSKLPWEPRFVELNAVNIGTIQFICNHFVYNPQFRKLVEPTHWLLSELVFLAQF